MFHSVQKEDTVSALRRNRHQLSNPSLKVPFSLQHCPKLNLRREYSMLRELIEKLKTLWRNIFHDKAERPEITETQNPASRPDLPPEQRQKKFSILCEQENPNPPVSYQRTDKKFELHGQQQDTEQGSSPEPTSEPLDVEPETESPNSDLEDLDFDDDFFSFSEFEENEPSGGKFEVHGEQEFSQPIRTNNSNSEGGAFNVHAATRPKKCPVCLTEGRVTKAESGEWQCKECEHTWR
ncbi:MAG: hypothetical protein QTN59_14025 [Candidatus Electrothrix communis]|nr:MAG: hypothetical protein QTN59_14025 [Candidatus Electrothrix communis]